MIQVLLMTEKEVQLCEVHGLTAVGGAASSGKALKSLKQSDDYAVLSTQNGKLQIHALKGKKIGAIELGFFERTTLLDLTLIPLPAVNSNAQKTVSADQSLVGELNRLLKFLSGQVDLQPLLQEVLQSLMEIGKLEKGFVVAKSPSDTYQVVASVGVNPQDPWLSETLLGEALKSQHPIFVQNVIGSPFEANKSLVSTGFLSVFVWPLKLRGESLGAIVVGSTRPHSGMNDSEKEVGEVYSQLAAFLLSTYLNDLRLKEQVEAMRRVRQGRQGPFLSNDPRMQELSSLAEKVAPTDLSLLIQGETGVGKEVLARWIHKNSEVGSGPFVAVNCGAIPENLLESTLFGHKKGAFTGAMTDQVGKFQLAHGGTLFLDEIGDLPLPVQVKLLRALQERVVEPLGSNKSVPVQVRILSASHKDIKALVTKGEFREDLYFRLAEVTLEIPALRDRPDDIGLIATEFLRESSPNKRLSREAWDWMRQQNWPGNIRELLSSLRRASVLSSGDEIRLEDFRVGVAPRTQESNWLGGSNLDEAMKCFLYGKVRKALELSGGNRKQAADLLGVTPRTLFRYLEDFRSDVTDVTV